MTKNPTRSPKPVPRATPSPMVVLAVVGAAILVAALLVFVSQPGALSSKGPSGNLPYRTGTTSEGLPYKGNPEAKVTVVEFSDFQCPFCKKYNDEVVPNIEKNYIITDKIRYIFRNFAFLGAESKDAAIASLCAQEQGQFWPYHDLLFANQGAENKGVFNKDSLEKWAGQLSLDTAAFRKCLDSGKYNATLESSRQEGRGLGVDGTPTLFVNGKRMPGPDEKTLTAAIEAALKAAQ